MPSRDQDSKGMPVTADPASQTCPSVSYFRSHLLSWGTHLERVFVNFGRIPNPLVLPIDGCPSFSATSDLFPYEAAVVLGFAVGEDFDEPCRCWVLNILRTFADVAC